MCHEFYLPLSCMQDIIDKQKRPPSSSSRKRLREGRRALFSSNRNSRGTTFFRHHLSIMTFGGHLSVAPLPVHGGFRRGLLSLSPLPGFDHDFFSRLRVFFMVLSTGSHQPPALCMF